MVVMLSVLCSVSMFPSFVSEASTTVVNQDFTFSHTFPKVYGSFDYSMYFPLNYEKVVSTGYTLEADKYYLFYFRQPFITQATWLYDPSSSDYVSANMYAVYGGNKYFFNERMCSFVTSGANTGTFSLGVDVGINIFPYFAGDGYIYPNECTVRFYTADTSSQKAMYIIYELDETELADAKQLSEIILLLGRLENYLSVYFPKLNTMDSKLTRIFNTLESILADTSSINTKLDSAIGLLEEANETLDSIEGGVVTANESLHDIYVQIWNLRKELTSQDSTDSDKMDNFNDNSSSQTSQLGQLTQESQVDKIDINNASSTVDSNLDFNTVTSSGVVLSEFTSHKKILAMLLGVTSISLISYVFFGKR